MRSFMATRDDPCVVPLLVHAARFDEGSERSPADHLLAKMAHRNSALISVIVQEYRKQAKSPEEFETALKKMLETSEYRW